MDLYQKVRRSRYTSVRIRISARDAESAGNTALDELDFIRGIWNLVLSANRRRVSFGGAGHRPFNDIVSGPFHTLHQLDGSPVDEIHWWEPSNTTLIPVADVKQKYAAMRDRERWVRSRLKKSRMWSTVRALYVRYARAMDERDLNTAFLKLWALLEDLVGLEHSNYEELIRRAKFISADPEYAGWVLEHIRDWRNRIVHDAAQPPDAVIFVNETKRYVEHLLGFVLEYPQHFGSLQDVGRFLSLPRDASILKARTKLHALAIAIHKRAV